MEPGFQNEENNLREPLIPYDAVLTDYERRRMHIMQKRDSKKARLNDLSTDGEEQQRLQGARVAFTPDRFQHLNSERL